MCMKDIITFPIKEQREKSEKFNSLYYMALKQKNPKIFEDFR